MAPYYGCVNRRHIPAGPVCGSLSAGNSARALVCHPFYRFSLSARAKAGHHTGCLHRLFPLKPDRLVRKLASAVGKSCPGLSFRRFWQPAEAYVPGLEPAFLAAGTGRALVSVPAVYLSLIHI